MSLTPEVMPACKCGHTVHQHEKKAGACSGNSNQCGCPKFRKLERP